ncbi:MAG: glycoside hydrolase family 88 protein [Clostridia bacterium]|nr:glycoside hydrolase family 88 protein [Clostridia bacterium]
MQERVLLNAAKAKKYIDSLTINSAVNIPEKVICEESFFTWDNEKRALPDQPYLFQWSYYNGVVLEGLYDIYAANGEEKYKDYVVRYLDSLIDDGGLIFRRAGYVNYHGADCYKTAALLVRFAGCNNKYDNVLQTLYNDLTSETKANDDGKIISKDFTESSLGGNYWHSWRGSLPPKRYKLWLDGIYMIQPFLARYSEFCGDKPQTVKIAKRLKYVAENLLAPNGLYYHASNGGGDDCPYFWTRASGWYAMALVDVAEVFTDVNKEVTTVCADALKLFMDGILPYRTANGMYLNLTDMPETATNRTETSGTSMVVYALLKGVRLGLLDKSYIQPALDSFCGMCESKLTESGLTDIYFKASANGTNNYENTADYLTDEGKGAGPFIMAYSEVLRLL